MKSLKMVLFTCVPLFVAAGCDIEVDALPDEERGTPDGGVIGIVHDGGCNAPDSGSFVSAGGDPADAGEEPVFPLPSCATYAPVTYVNYREYDTENPYAEPFGNSVFISGDRDGRYRLCDDTVQRWYIHHFFATKGYGQLVVMVEHLEFLDEEPAHDASCRADYITVRLFESFSSDQNDWFAWQEPSRNVAIVRAGKAGFLYTQQFEMSTAAVLGRWDIQVPPFSCAFVQMLEYACDHTPLVLDETP